MHHLHHPLAGRERSTEGRKTHLERQSEKTICFLLHEDKESSCFLCFPPQRFRFCPCRTLYFQVLFNRRYPILHAGTTYTRSWLNLSIVAASCMHVQQALDGTWVEPGCVAHLGKAHLGDMQADFVFTADSRCFHVSVATHLHSLNGRFKKLITRMTVPCSLAGWHNECADHLQRFSRKEELPNSGSCTNLIALVAPRNVWPTTHHLLATGFSQIWKKCQWNKEVDVVSWSKIEPPGRISAQFIETNLLFASVRRTQARHHTLIYTWRMCTWTHPWKIILERRNTGTCFWVNWWFTRSCLCPWAHLDLSSCRNDSWIIKLCLKCWSVPNISSNILHNNLWIMRRNLWMPGTRSWDYTHS